MSEKYNILVVEDMQIHFDRLYKRALNDARFIVDHANNESEAKEKIRCKNYHVAFVDIYLRENSQDRGGVEVIKYFHELRENTAIIVVSATDDIDVALDVYNAGICGFLKKGDMLNPRENILSALEKALESFKYQQVSLYGRFSIISAYLANPELTPYWEDRCTRILGTNYKNCTAALNNSLANRLPVLRYKGRSVSLDLNEADRTATGYFWSKSIGQPIMLSLAFADSSLPEPRRDLTSEKVYERTIGNLQVAVYVIQSGMARAEFCESVWEEPV